MVKNTDSGKHEKIAAEEFKRKQGYEMIEKGLKNSVIAEKLQVDRRKVIELKEKGLSARAIAKSMECSITPVLRILRENRLPIG